MKRYLLIFVPLLLLGNKGCPKGASWEHPVLDKTASCADCHDDGRARDKKPAGHDLAWETNHGSWIRKSGLRIDAQCQVCHTEATCTNCHQQQKPKNHNEYWRLKGHGLAVGLDRNRCFTCHRGADFCGRCHAETRPTDHLAAWGTPTNRHCLNCHFPLTSFGAQKCAVCHATAPSHTNMPTQPANALHVTGADCRSCHSPLKHPDNGSGCTTCHTH